MRTRSTHKPIVLLVRGPDEAETPLASHPPVERLLPDPITLRGRDVVAAARFPKVSFDSRRGRTLETFISRVGLDTWVGRTKAADGRRYSSDPGATRASITG